MADRGRGLGRSRVLALAAGVLVLSAAACSADDASPSTPAGASGPTTGSSDGSGTPTTGQQSEPSTGQPPSTASEQPTSEPPPPPPRRITVVMNGDMLLHEGLWTTARIDAARTGRGVMDFRPLLANLRSVVSHADLAICHMETPLAPAGGPYQGYPVFAAPPAIVPALKWEGYDACTTASNHSLDQGFDGITRTLHDFAQAGIRTAGTAATKKASQRPLVMDVAGVKVALISATYGTNGIPLPADEPWSVPIINTDKIEHLASVAKTEGADIVLVALHWGLEYTHPPIQDQIDVADVLTQDPDIDLIYGHHAHVVQPYDKINHTWVVYGLGNAVAQQDTAVEGVYDGNTCRVTFVERPNGSFKVEKLEYIPTMITPFSPGTPMRWLNVPKDLDDPGYTSLRPQLLATASRVTSVVGSLGAFRKGVVEGR